MVYGAKGCWNQKMKRRAARSSEVGLAVNCGKAMKTSTGALEQPCTHFQWHHSVAHHDKHFGLWSGMDLKERNAEILTDCSVKSVGKLVTLDLISDGSDSAPTPPSCALRRAVLVVY